MSKYRTTPHDTDRMPPGIPYIISNEAAERFSFYGMKAALAVFLANYLVVLGGENMSEAGATKITSLFNSAVYLTPLLGAIIADAFFGKYRTIMTLSVVYCLGHGCLAMIGVGGLVQFWLLAGLGLISLGAGGIKPCVSAHVGDQFGARNQHKLTAIFNIFYFSINFGAVLSNLLIPWVLLHHGPHLAFGIPGVLMALATVFFWMGRRKFAHLPAKGRPFLKELFSRIGLSAIFKLTPLIFFIGMFWCLFDQTANRLVFQGQRMNNDFGGMKILPEQIQAANPFLILVLIPLFMFVIYPVVGKFIKLTPLRKIGAGMILMSFAFVVVSLCQESIDAGNRPHLAWQFVPYLILTSAEIMVSIVGLEFFYTQAPRKMKSFMMAIFLVSVAIGNLFTAAVNTVIQVPSPAFSESGSHNGFDEKAGTADDLSKNEDDLKSPASDTLKTLAGRIETEYKTNGKLPLELADLPNDPWGNRFVYRLKSSTEAEIESFGPDGKAQTEWDLGVKLTVRSASEFVEGTWLHEEKKKLGLIEQDEGSDIEERPLSVAYTAGGGETLEGAAYFWFFTKLMIISAVLFIPFALLYRPRTYLPSEDDTPAPQP